jgi:hypothetical protein
MMGMVYFLLADTGPEEGAKVRQSRLLSVQGSLVSEKKTKKTKAMRRGRGFRFLRL